MIALTDGGIKEEPSGTKFFFDWPPILALHEFFASVHGYIP
jgi:hypothetical protein